MIVKNSERLKFKMITEQDVGFLFDLDQDPEVMRFINGGKTTTLEEVNSIFIPRLKSYFNREKGWGLFNINVQATNEPVGWILIRPMGFFSETPEYRNLEIGWRLFRNTWGKGYATEAAAAVLEAVLQKNKVDFVSALAMEQNEASIRMMKKLGMEFVKKYTHEDPLGDEECVYYRRQV